MKAFERYYQQMVDLETAHLRRQCPSYLPVDATHVVPLDIVEERAQRGSTTFPTPLQHIMMASNNYLGLTHHPEVKAAAQNALDMYGTGSGGSRLTSGSFPLFDALEWTLAELKGTDCGLVFNTGYMANVGTISALVGKGDTIFSDELNHASIIDGCRLSGATVCVYPHKDMVALEELLLKAPTTGIRLIVTDSVFSMDGDIAPLEELAFLARRHDALLMTDDAHATGVLGDGRGSAHYFGLTESVDIQMGTLSKALASEGGFVCGKKLLIDTIINKARSFIFSTALTPADIAAALAAVEIIIGPDSPIPQLHSNEAYMKEALAKNGITVHTESPIFPIMIGEADKALRIAEQLRDRSIILTPIRPPSVPDGKSRLRLTVTAAHSEADLDYVANCLGDILKN
ncbi:8-amino-7-oxononanoate synthase [Veillonella magna]|uniref:8-amino-7-oxononanoate synthase n=1 Tax=Veillonella magna TaxID=464322 RepID=UPI0023F03F06|nr:8-amino-7-oxononanoate synthase [Veillonella magna]